MSMVESTFGAVQLLERFVQRIDSNLSFRIKTIGQLVEYISSCVLRSTGGGLCMFSNRDVGVEPCESGHTVFTNWSNRYHP